MKTLITGATVVNEGMAVKADILIEDDRIVSILSNGETPRDNYDETVDATGCFVLPGVIDDHVHISTCLTPNLRPPHLPTLKTNSIWHGRRVT